ncbi:MAG TPA: tetratricopeptide repeat protein [Longimicrobiales bacterium]|nr:tetratricopeptide repeat protein [Longimicrobiales bacterium]
MRVDQIMMRGREAFERGDFEAALADFREVLEHRPEYADIWHLAGVCLSLLGYAEEALVEFERALAVNERYVEARLNYAITLNELGRYEEAQAAFEQAGRHEEELGGRFPGVLMARIANAHASLGDLYREAGAHGEAIAQYRAALELRPTYHDIRTKLARVLMDTGDLAGAEAELGVAVEGNPRYLQARLLLGLVYHRRGEVDRAAAEWERCREQNPNHPQVRSFLSLLERRSVAHDPIQPNS